MGDDVGFVRYGQWAESFYFHTALFVGGDNKHQHIFRPGAFLYGIPAHLAGQTLSSCDDGRGNAVLDLEIQSEVYERAGD